MEIQVEPDVEMPLLGRVEVSPSRHRYATLGLLLAFFVTVIILATTTGHLASLQPPVRKGPFDGMVFEDMGRIVQADVGVVAADEARCSVIGRDALRAGGNAIDATVATALCLGVVNPMASGIGGGAFLLLRLANGSAEIYDMRETAPAAASEDMYEANPDSKEVGALSMGVPGELAGLHLAWEHHGRLPWETLVRPAISLASNGFVIHRYLAKAIHSSGSKILADKGLKEIFAPRGKLLVAGEMCWMESLAQTLQQVAKDGPSVLYNGTVGQKLVEDVQAAGGILTAHDLKEYKVEIRKPIVADTMGFTILGMPPPSSGGAALFLILNIMAMYGTRVSSFGVLGLHRMIEAFKHTYAVRMNLGDPAFVDVTSVLADMLSPEFAAELQKLISDNTTFAPVYYGGRWSQLQDHGTSHFGIVDAERNAVAMTSTINYSFGAKVLSRRTGILLNNEMDDFSIPTDIKPDHLPPAPQNFVRPNKRPLSSMSPTIFLKNGQLRAVLGASGGSKIITAVAQVFLNHFVKELDPLSSVLATRVHHQLGPNKVQYENWTLVTGDHLELAPAVREGLQQRGHELESQDSGAISQLVLHELTTPAHWPPHLQKPTGEIFYGKLIGVSDERKDGSPAGF